MNWIGLSSVLKITFQAADSEAPRLDDLDPVCDKCEKLIIRVFLLEVVISPTHSAHNTHTPSHSRFIAPRTTETTTLHPHCHQPWRTPQIQSYMMGTLSTDTSSSSYLSTNLNQPQYQFGMGRERDRQMRLYKVLLL